MALTLAVIGFGQPDSLRLLDALRTRDREAKFIDTGTGQATDAVRSGATVALVWSGPGEVVAAGAVAEAIGAGLPVVLLLQKYEFRRAELSHGVVEFCFPPITPDEVITRLEIARVRSRGPAGANVISHGELRIDMDSYEVTIAGKKLDLTYKEYELLKYLASTPGRVFSREALLRSVWEYDYFGGTRTVDVHIRRLRSKMDDMRYRFIETVWNVGYRFSAPAADAAESRSGAPDPNSSHA